MPSCPTEQQLHSLLTEKLTGESRDAVSQHVETCAACQTTLEHFTSAADTVLFSDEAPQNAKPTTKVPPVVAAPRSTKEPRPAGPASTAQDPAVGRLMDQLRSTPPAWAFDSDPKPPPVHESPLATHDTILQFPVAPSAVAPLGELGHYQIREFLGSGASGLLYKAFDTQLERTVAVKVLRSELAMTADARARMIREAKTAASLKNDNVVTIYQVSDASANDGFPPYIVMEFVDGETLSTHIRRRKTVPSREAAEIVRQVANGLATAHRQGMIHRDVKSSNIMLERPDGRVKLMDFGLARWEQATTQITMGDSIAGTPAYMSPEQISSPQAVDGRSDIYSLGIVLYELLTGRTPFVDDEHGTVRSALYAALHKAAPPPSQFNQRIPGDLETICLKAIAKEPSQRYDSADELADDLRRFLSRRQIHARPESKASRVVRWCRRNPLPTTLGATSACLLVLLCFFAFRDDDEGPTFDKNNGDVTPAAQETGLASLVRNKIQEFTREHPESYREVKEHIEDTEADFVREIQQHAELLNESIPREVVANWVELLIYTQAGSVLVEHSSENAAQLLHNAERLLEEQLTNVADKTNVAKIQVEIQEGLGRIAYEDDDWHGAAGHLQAAAEFLLQLPKDNGRERHLAGIYFQLAETCEELDEDTKASEWMAKSFRLRKDLASNSPRDLDVAVDVINCQHWLVARLTEEDQEKAQEQMTEAVQLARKMFAQLSLPKHEDQLDQVKDSIGEMIKEFGDLEDIDFLPGELHAFLEGQVAEENDDGDEDDNENPDDDES